MDCFQHVPEHHAPVELVESNELRPGHVLDGRFRLTQAISRSGMAVIYKAEDLQNGNETVAVKIPHLRYELDPNYFSRFKREEEIGRALNHPFVLKFIPVENKSRPYLVTEYLAGCTLAHLIHAQRPFSEQDALRIVSLMCDAVEHLHERGVIHRDLKPSNVMVLRDHTIRLVDFGIASAAAARRITMAGGFGAGMGTPDYMAPEQVRNKQCDVRTDIYSLGVILYEMLTGMLPFRDENPWVAMNNRVHGDPVAPRKLNPKISPQAEEIVLHCLQRDPQDRYQSAAELKMELDAPGKVFVSGYCHRLQAPRFRIGLRETPVLAGTLLGVGVIALQVIGFFLLRHLGHR